MAKLIHSAALANVKASTLLWANDAYTKAALSALIFTDDGFIVAKGTEYQVALKSNAERTSAPPANNTDYTKRYLWSDSGVLKLIDSARFFYTGPHIDYVKTEALAANSIMYLTGSASSSATTGALKVNDSVYVQTDAGGNETLVAPGVKVSGGASNFYLNETNLHDYIEGLVISGIQTNDAMVFAGTLKVVGTDLYFTSHNSNLTYGVTITDLNNDNSNLAQATKLSQITNYSAGWTFKVINNGTPTGFSALESGDMIIATNGSDTSYSAANFNVVQANIDGAVTAPNALPANALLIGADGTKSLSALGFGTAGQFLKSGGDGAAPTWASFGTLTLDGTADFVFNPSASNTLVVGKGLDVTSAVVNGNTVYTLGHSNTAITAQATAALKKFAFDAYGHITGVADVAKLTLKAQNSSGNSVNANGVVNKTYDGSSAVDFILKAGDNITLTQTTSGTITIASAFTNTWRPVYAWLLSGMAVAGDTIDQMLGNGVGTKSLAFSSTFGYQETTHTVGGNSVAVAEVDLVWAEVDDNGNISYSF